MFFRRYTRRKGLFGNVLTDTAVHRLLEVSVSWTAKVCLIPYLCVTFPQYCPHDDQHLQSHDGRHSYLLALMRLPMTGPLDLIPPLHILVFIPKVSLLRHTYLRLPQTWYINPFTLSNFHTTPHARLPVIANLDTCRASPTEQQ